MVEDGGDAVEVVTATPADGVVSTPLDELAGRSVTHAVEDAHARVGRATVAKILFTSGSTGHPKGVINTQEMLCANQEQLRTVLRFLADEPPILCDWLPWNHTFGGNHNFGIVLYNGGTLYLDEGRPVAGLMDRTIANLREVATTAYFNVPKGFEFLLPVLRSNDEFRQHFFSRVRILFYAAAGLRQEIADGFHALALETCGHPVPWVTGLGATESAPFALCTGALRSPTTFVGVPVPGLELKVAPVGELFEARLQGPNVTPGYWRDAESTRAAFDEEGFYRMGDAIAPADPADPAKGFTFSGRLNEDFKLSTGTWVRVGPLRRKLLAALGNLAQDVVIAGHGQDTVSALVFPNLSACRTFTGVGADEPVAELLAHAQLRQTLGDRLARFNEEHPASSTAIARAILLDEPPSIDAMEVTDKGSINQKAVLKHRAAIVESLYAPAEPSPAILI